MACSILRLGSSGGGTTIVRGAAALLFLLPTSVLADQVFLRDAGTITGRIVEQTDALVRVDVGGGIIGVPMDRVDRIEKGRTALDDFDDRAKALASDDLAGWKKLGQWAGERGLAAQSQDAYKKVLKLAPNDPDANRAFGRVELNGHWVTQEESYRARGYVEYDGEWMTPAQAQVAQTEAANDKARRDAEQRARDAEAAARDADARAREAEARAKEAEQSNPLYWGGWGYGLVAWPSGTPQ
jgi:hypothetical protein